MLGLVLGVGGATGLGLCSAVSLWRVAESLLALCIGINASVGHNGEARQVSSSFGTVGVLRSTKVRGALMNNSILSWA